MVDISELISGLKENLAGCDFVNHAGIIIGQGCNTTVISTNGTTCPKLICAVASIPPDVTGARQARDFMRTLRRGLTGHFSGFPRPRRLGTCTVLIGGREQCKALEPHKAELVDQRGLHINVMLSTILLDADTFTTRSETTWGIMDMATPLARIQSAVENWCARYRQPRRMVQAGSRSLKIA